MFLNATGSDVNDRSTSSLDFNFSVESHLIYGIKQSEVNIQFISSNFSLEKTELKNADKQLNLNVSHLKET